MITARDRYRSVQSALGFAEDDQDGIPGPKTANQFSTLAAEALAEIAAEKKPEASGTLRGGPGWKFSARIDGADIVIEDATATWFGGVNDPLDNGETASGVSTRPKATMGCALPVIGGIKSTAGSPIAFPASGKKPGIPWKTSVQFTRKGVTVTVPLLDNGPARSAGDASDLTQAAFLKLAPDVSLKAGVLKGVTIRIRGAAKFAKA